MSMTEARPNSLRPSEAGIVRLRAKARFIRLGRARTVRRAGTVLGRRLPNRGFTTFVMLGDGEMQAGQVWEAATFAAHHGLSRLHLAIADRSGFRLDGKVEDVVGIEPLDDKWRAFGWEVHVVDGHDIPPTGSSRLTRCIPTAGNIAG